LAIGTVAVGVDEDCAVEMKGGPEGTAFVRHRLAVDKLGKLVDLAWQMKLESVGTSKSK
jgi:hypothetical protein